MNNFRKIVLVTTIAIFCALIGANTYIAAKNLRVTQQYATQRTNASASQSDIAAVRADLDAVGSGQQGYLISGDKAYLEQYTRAAANLPGEFSTLRSRLAGRPQQEQASESELEGLGKAKIAEAEETIRLREKGYRHRAFLIVMSSRGKELMDKAHALLDRLAAVETRNVAQADAQVSGSIATALQDAMLGSAILLVLTVLALLAFDLQRKRLERRFGIQTEELRAVRERLDQLTTAVSSTLGTTVAQMREHAECLLNVHGGFLPRQGQERAEWIYEGSCQIERLLGQLLAPPPAAEIAGSDDGLKDDEYSASEDYPRSQSA